MTLLEIHSTRPWLSWGAATYAFDPPPRFVIGGMECSGSWRRGEPLAIDIFPGVLRVAAYQVHNHPVAALVYRGSDPRPAELAIEVPPDCESVAIEFRTSRSVWSPGRLLVRQMLYG